MKRFSFCKTKLNYSYFVAPFAILFVSLTGGSITQSGMVWYKSLNLPSFTPPGFVIGAVWTAIYVLTASSFLILWNSKKIKKEKQTILILFVLNIFLNVAWSFLFF